MKILYTFIILISLFFVPLSVNAWIFDDDSQGDIPYCEGNSCWWLEEWVEQVWWKLSWVVTDIWFSQYIQNIVTYLLTFVSVIAVIYLIYAWFITLTSAGDEDKVKKTKQIMIYVIVWILIIWFAWGILSFIIWLLWWNSWGNCAYCYSLPSWATKDQCLDTYNCLIK